ncbi:cilia- and flagella-associated protein 70-like isoform X2 [Thalassophryne amazonica]|uniref:cilia- and flagella-associated protein 70-like isoform X2 n=1 Tax=Thalassophryne amazonica TaxID=390379 RepID=UPI001471162D|nr:cilia- and flagella-associated protein 70-like isoform X2 [Thalassophryne amazonica]
METRDNNKDNVTIKTTVVRGHNLHGSCSDSFQSFVQVEMNSTVMGESKLKQVEPVELCVDYDFTCSCHFSKTPQTLDDIAHKPIILTVVEVLSKKKLEERVVLGQAVVDLLPLLQGQCSFFSAVPVHPLTVSAGDTSSQDSSSKPILDVSVSVMEPVLSEAELSRSTLLKVTMETVYCVPEAWTRLSDSAPCTYRATLKVPLTAEKDQVLTFSDGELRAGGQREAEGRQKKRPHRALLAPGNHVLPGTFIQTVPIEEEDGELTGPEDVEFRTEAETLKDRVSWDTERCCFLDSSGTDRLRQRISESRLWPVEIMKSSLQTKSVTNTLSDEEDPQVSSHGVAFVDVGLLLCPGVSRIRGAYSVHPSSESELLNNVLIRTHLNIFVSLKFDLDLF